MVYKLSRRNLGGTTPPLENEDTSMLSFLNKGFFWKSLIILFILMTIFYILNFFNKRYIYILYGIILFIIVNVINKRKLEDNSNNEENNKTLSRTPINQRNKKYKNEPYKINYTNPFITNLDNINFNFRLQYNFGDFKTYLFNKIDELLLSKYISFYKVLSFNKGNLVSPLLIKEKFDINDNYTNIFMGLAKENIGKDQIPYVSKENNEGTNRLTNDLIYIKTKALFLMRGNILQIPALGLSNEGKPVSTSTNEIDKEELYIHIYEKNDLNKYEIKDNLTVIQNDINSQNRCTLIDTNLNADTQYVAHISYLCNKDFRIPRILSDTISDDPYENELRQIAQEKYDNLPNLTNGPGKFTIENIMGYIKEKEAQGTNKEKLEIINLVNINLLHETLKEGTNLYNSNITTNNHKIAVIARLKELEYRYYKDDGLLQHDINNKTVDSNKPYFPKIENNIYYPLDHAMFVKKKSNYGESSRRTIVQSYPYLLIPVILIDKPNININKPLFYENTKDILKNRKQREWLLKEYEKIISTQFKGYIFNIKSYYRKYLIENMNLKYNVLFDTIETIDTITPKLTTLNDKILDPLTPNSNDNTIREKDDFYRKHVSKTNDIEYSTYNNLNKSKNIENQWGFDITIENIRAAMDRKNNELSRDTMPYLIIKYGLIKKNKDNVLELDSDSIVYTIINLSISNSKNIFYDKNKEYPLLYNKLSDQMFNKTNEITLNKEKYIEELNKIKEEMMLEEIPDKYILKDISTKLKQFNNPYSNNKIFISENFVNTEFLYDYKIKMNMIVSKILEHYFSANLLSIREWTFNFDNLKLIKINKLLKYGNNKKLVLKNIPLTTFNINKHFRHIYELREQYRHFLLNIYKNLWFISESNDKPENYISDYFIYSNNKYYYFDSNKAREYKKDFYNNIEIIINRSPIINTTKQIGHMKYFIKHIGIKNNLLINASRFNINNLNNIQDSDTIEYKAINRIYNDNPTNNAVLGGSSNISPTPLLNNDLFILNQHQIEDSAIQTDINKTILINNISDDIKKSNIISISNDSIIIKLNRNANINNKSNSNSNTRRPIYQYELFNRKFIYVSKDSFKNNNESYKYPSFIKIGQNIESTNINVSDQGYMLPDIKLIEEECNVENTSTINNETNIFPIINAYTIGGDANDIYDKKNTNYSKESIIMLELPSNITWTDKINENNKEIEFNNYKDEIKNKYYKIFDYTNEFNISNLLGNFLVIEKLIFDKNTVTRFKIELNKNSIEMDKLINYVRNAKLYEKYVTFHNESYDNKKIIKKLIENKSEILLNQNTLYKIYNICKDTALTNSYIIEFETYYDVIKPGSSNIWDSNNKYIINNKISNINLSINKYNNIDRNIDIINKNIDKYTIKENICDYISDINKCFEEYKAESTKDISNMNQNIWDMKNFYSNKTLIEFKIDNIVKAGTDSKRNTYMTQLIDNIIFNEVCKIHYNIPKKIGINITSKQAVDEFKYSGEIYIPYYKRNQKISTININTDSNICLDYGNQIRTNVVSINKLAIYNVSIATFNQYYYYYKNIFTNILGLYDDINTECNNFIKLGKSVLNKDKTLNQSTKLSSLKKYIKIPLNLNKYLTFSDNYMLFIRKTKKILEDNNTSLTNEMLGLPIIVNNRYFDSTYLSKFSSNTENTKKCKLFLEKFIKQFEIGMSGFTEDIAEEICSRIYTVFDKKNCNDPTNIKINFDGDNTWYKKEKDGKFDIDIYNHNKQVDKCFNTIFNDVEHTESKKLKSKKKWIFLENCEDQQMAYFGKTNPTSDEKTNVPEYNSDKECWNNRQTKTQKNTYDPTVKDFLESVNLSEHRLATIDDIKKGIRQGMSVEGYGFIKDKNLYNLSPLVKPVVKEFTDNNDVTTKKLELNYINKSDINKYKNKGLFCYGRKPDNSKLSRDNEAAIYYFNQRKIKQNIKDIKKYENIEDFSVPKDNYSAWN